MDRELSLFEGGNIENMPEDERAEETREDTLLTSTVGHSRRIIAMTRTEFLAQMTALCDKYEDDNSVDGQQDIIDCQLTFSEEIYWWNGKFFQSCKGKSHTKEPCHACMSEMSMEIEEEVYEIPDSAHTCKIGRKRNCKSCHDRLAQADGYCDTCFPSNGSSNKEQT